MRLAAVLSRFTAVTWNVSTDLARWDMNEPIYEAALVELRKFVPRETRALLLDSGSFWRSLEPFCVSKKGPGREGSMAPWQQRSGRGLW